jgi:hypothetical protein
VEQDRRHSPRLKYDATTTRRFNDACKIPADKIRSIAYRYQRITRQMNRDFWSTESETAHSLYTGSYGRDTAAKGISDLDMGFMLPVSLYHQFTKYAGNGQSSILQTIKKSMQNTYRTSDIGGDGQVVVIRFDDGITLEVLPVFENKDGSSWTYPMRTAASRGRSVIHGQKLRRLLTVTQLRTAT